MSTHRKVSIAFSKQATSPRLYEYECGGIKFYATEKMPQGIRLHGGKAVYTKNYYPVSGSLAKDLRPQKSKIPPKYERLADWLVNGFDWVEDNDDATKQIIAIGFNKEQAKRILDQALEDSGELSKLLWTVDLIDWIEAALDNRPYHFDTDR